MLPAFVTPSSIEYRLFRMSVIFVSSIKATFSPPTVPFRLTAGLCDRHCCHPITPTMPKITSAITPFFIRHLFLFRYSCSRQSEVQTCSLRFLSAHRFRPQQDSSNERPGLRLRPPDY